MSSARLLLIALVLFASTAQNFLTQSHIHPVSRDRAGVALQLSDAPAKPGNLPVGDDSQNCQLCKEFAQSGQFLGGTWLAFALPAQLVSSLETGIISKWIATYASFRWNSRAPPRH